MDSSWEYLPTQTGLLVGLNLDLLDSEQKGAFLGEKGLES